jgi:predicted nucleic acid-binding protein
VEAAFWDSSSLVPLFAKQPSSVIAVQMASQYELVVWWAAPVEAKSALARLLRMGLITPDEFAVAQIDLDQLRQSWREVMPSWRLRAEAESFVDRFQLKAADAQQLAAAYTWSMGQPAGHVFLSGDRQLLESARQPGFQAIAT